MVTQREYVEIELAAAQRALANVTDSGRQVNPSSAGQKYREQLLRDIAHLEERLASEEE